MVIAVEAIISYRAQIFLKMTLRHGEVYENDQGAQIEKIYYTFLYYAVIIMLAANNK
jgi:hypothetical protein